MKVIEVEIEEHLLEELKLASSKISYMDLRKQIARTEALHALKESNKIASQEGLDHMSEEDVTNVIREARSNYGKSSY